MNNNINNSINRNKINNSPKNKNLIFCKLINKIKKIF